MSFRDTIQKIQRKKREAKFRKLMRRYVRLIMAFEEIEYLPYKRWGEFHFKKTTGEIIRINEYYVKALITKHKYAEARATLIDKLSNPKEFLMHCKQHFEDNTLKEITLLVAMQTIKG